MNETSATIVKKGKKKSLVFADGHNLDARGTQGTFFIVSLNRLFIVQVAHSYEAIKQASKRYKYPHTYQIVTTAQEDTSSMHGPTEHESKAAEPKAWAGVKARTEPQPERTAQITIEISESTASLLREDLETLSRFTAARALIYELLEVFDKS